MRILIVDDNPDQALRYSEFFTERKHDVTEICEGRYEEAGDKVIQHLRSVQAPADVYDFLLLDINYDDHFIGGVRIYNRILREGLRGRFHHIMVPTQFMGQKNSDGYRATCAFLELAFVPRDNMFAKNPEGIEKMHSRMLAIVGERDIPVANFAKWEFR